MKNKDFMRKHNISMLFTLAPVESEKAEQPRPSRGKPHQDKSHGNKAHSQFVRDVKDDTRKALEEIRLERQFR